MNRQIICTFIGVAQSVAFERDFRFELFPAQITEVTFLCVVSVHVSLQVTPAAARIVTHTAHIRLHTYTPEQKNNHMRQQQYSKNMTFIESRGYKSVSNQDGI